MTVKVYSGDVLVEEVTFESESIALLFADEQQDNGFHVRISE